MRARAKVDGVFPHESKLPLVGIAGLAQAEGSVAVECFRVGPDVGVMVQLGHGEGNARVGGEMEAVFEGVGFHGASLDGDCGLLSIGT